MVPPLVMAPPMVAYAPARVSVPHTLLEAVGEPLATVAGVVLTRTTFPGMEATCLKWQTPSRMPANNQIGGGEVLRQIYTVL